MLSTNNMINISALPVICNTSSLLENPINHLFKKLHAVQFCKLVRYASGRVLRVPANMRGNKVYAWYQSIRMNQIQTEIDKVAKIEGDYTNVIFLTLTHEYNKKSIESILDSWQVVPARLTKFLRKLKTFFRLIHYVGVLEAHEGGGCHAHVVLVTREPIHCTRDGKGVLRLPDSYRDKIKEYWTENVDVRGSDSTAIAGYLTKELGKVNHVEEAIKRASKGQETASDRKKIWAYYWADVLGIRLLRVSRSIKVDPEEEDENPDESRLDNLSDNPTESAKDEIVAVLTIYRNQYKKWDWWSCWTGEISPDSEEYQKIEELFEQTTPSGLTSSGE